MKEEILKKKCPKCNKILKSLSQRQLDYNFSQHLESHKRKVDKSKKKVDKRG